jgi:hypothetical protein
MWIRGRQLCHALLKRRAEEQWPVLSAEERMTHDA